MQISGKLFNVDCYSFKDSDGKVQCGGSVSVIPDSDNIVNTHLQRGFFPSQFKLEQNNESQLNSLVSQIPSPFQPNIPVVIDYQVVPKRGKVGVTEARFLGIKLNVPKN
jgi:hypothetical protein